VVHVTPFSFRSATRLEDLEESGARWTTLTDPAGNEFDLVAQPAG